MKAKKYIWSMICVYMAYLTHGMQALIFSQNQVNFATKWGFDMTDPSSAAYAAGVAAVWGDGEGSLKWGIPRGTF